MYIIWQLSELSVHAYGHEGFDMYHLIVMLSVHFYTAENLLVLLIVKSGRGLIMTYVC